MASKKAGARHTLQCAQQVDKKVKRLKANIASVDEHKANLKCQANFCNLVFSPLKITNFNLLPKATCTNA